MVGIRTKHSFLWVGSGALLITLGCGSPVVPPASSSILPEERTSEAPSPAATGERRLKPTFLAEKTAAAPVGESKPVGTAAAVTGPAEKTPAATAPSITPAKPAAAPAAETTKSPAAPHEALFEGWPTPKLALVITGDQWGYIEPCGCTGLANQKGGLARRYTFLEELRGKGWPLVPLDTGNQVRRFGRQSEIKFQVAAEGLKKMGYQAIGFGPDDLRLSFGELVSAVVSADEKNPSPFMSANVSLGGDLTPRFRVLTAAGKKIGVTGVLGPSYQKQVTSTDITVEPAEAALKKVMPELVAAKCDLYVLLSYGAENESKALAEKFPQFQIVVTAGISGEPTRDPERLNQGKTLLVQTGYKGMYVGVIGVFDDARQPLRYQRVPLDARFADAPAMMAQLKSYQQQLESIGLAGLELEPKPHASGHKFVGSKACADCHTKAYEIWEKTPHAHATDSLVHPNERSDIPRHFDPECLSCHVTGWNPQGFAPLLSGYLDLKKTPKMVANGCENCHGPGSAHVAAESDGKATKADLEKLRAELRVPVDKIQQSCLPCHDLDNSPDFHAPGAFEKYWKRVEHKGKD